MRARAQDIKISIFEMQMEYKYLHKHEQLAKKNGMESKDRPSAGSVGSEISFFPPFPLPSRSPAQSECLMRKQACAQLEDTL